MHLGSTTSDRLSIHAYLYILVYSVALQDESASIFSRRTGKEEGQYTRRQLAYGHSQIIH